MLMPSKVKFRKQQRGRRAGMAYRGGEVAFGVYLGHADLPAGRPTEPPVAHEAEMCAVR